MDIKSFLEKTKMPATDFAKLIGVSDASVSLYISRNRSPRPSIARKIVKATRGKVRLDDLYPAEAEGERA